MEAVGNIAAAAHEARTILRFNFMLSLWPRDGNGPRYIHYDDPAGVDVAGSSCIADGANQFVDLRVLALVASSTSLFLRVSPSCKMRLQSVSGDEFGPPSPLRVSASPAAVLFVPPSNHPST